MPSRPLTRRLINRRQFIGGAGMAAAATVLGSGGLGGGGAASASVLRSTSLPKATKGTLNIYSWPEYFSTKNLNGFGSTTDTTVNISTYQSNDALFAKLNATHGDGFDMAIPTSGWVPVLVDAGLLEEIDHSRIPFNYISKSLLGKAFDPQNKHSIPKDYGVTGVVYNTDFVTKPIVSWSDFLDAGASKGVSGKVDLGSGSEEILGVALWAAGRDWNTDNTAYIQEAGDTMKSFAKHVKEFNGFDVTGYAKGTIVLAMVDQSVGRQAQLQNPKLRYVVPTPSSELWVDNYTIVAGARDADRAYDFIDWQLQPSHQLADTEYIGYPTVYPGLERELPATFPLKSQIFIGPATFERLTTFIVRPKIQQLFENLYNEIVAAAG